MKKKKKVIFISNKITGKNCWGMLQLQVVEPSIMQAQNIVSDHKKILPLPSPKNKTSINFCC